MELMQTRMLREKDKQYIWHPFTQASEWDAEAFPVIEKAGGCYLYDTDGRQYLDGISSLWVNVHGHTHPGINAAIRDQLEKVAHSTLLGLASPPAIELAEKLVRLSPGRLSRVFYSDSGSTAVEVALKIAYQYCRQSGKDEDRDRTRFIAFTDAYHGDTVGSVSLGGMDLFHGIYSPLLFDAIRAPYPYCYRCPLDKEHGTCGTACLKVLEEILEREGKTVCALVIEPLVQGASGIITAPEGFLARVARLCRKHGVLLVCDEVATGFGRTGRMFACEHEGVAPDLMAVAKGLSGGYLPLAATLATQEIYEAFHGPYDMHQTFFHGHSFTGNALGCAAAIASIDLFREENTLERLRKKISLLTSLLETHVAPLKHVGQVRQCGTMVGIELVADRADKTSFPPSDRMGRAVVLEARRRGIIIRPLGDVVVLMPPLSMPDDALGELVRGTAESIRAVTEEV